MPDRAREMGTAHARQGLGNRYCRLPQVVLFEKVRPDTVGRPNAGRLMPETASATTSLLTRPLVLVAAAAGFVLAGTLALWAHYGTAVFYEMIVAGIAACL
jgi:hypothetical protein